MTTYNFPNHLKGDTFLAKQIDLGFSVVGAIIEMQFRVQGSSTFTFEWSTVNNTITVSNASLGIIIMNQRILDFYPTNYVYDFQITDASGNVKTYFKGSLLIEQDITV